MTKDERALLFSCCAGMLNSYNTKPTRKPSHFNKPPKAKVMGATSRETDYHFEYLLDGDYVMRSTKKTHHRDGMAFNVRLNMCMLLDEMSLVEDDVILFKEALDHYDLLCRLLAEI